MEHILNSYTKVIIQYIKTFKTDKLKYGNARMYLYKILKKEGDKLRALDSAKLSQGELDKRTLMQLIFQMDSSCHFMLNGRLANILALIARLENEIPEIIKKSSYLKLKSKLLLLNGLYVDKYKEKYLEFLVQNLANVNNLMTLFQNTELTIEDYYILIERTTENITHLSGLFPNETKNLIKSLKEILIINTDLVDPIKLESSRIHVNDFMVDISKEVLNG